MSGSLLMLLSAWNLAVGAPAAGQEQTNVLTSVAEITAASNPAELSGRRAELSNVRVQRVLNAQVILIGAPSDRSLIVRREDKNPKLRPGQTVNVNGTLNQMPVTTQGWDLPGNAAGLLKGHSIFLNATSLQVHQAPDRPAKRSKSGKTHQAGGATGSGTRLTNRL